jgi:hypothetical protein
LPRARRSGALTPLAALAILTILNYRIIRGANAPLSYTTISVRAIGKFVIASGLLFRAVPLHSIIETPMRDIASATPKNPVRRSEEDRMLESI